MTTKPKVSLTTLQTATVDTFIELARIHLASTERLSALALSTARTSLDDCVAATQAASSMTGGGDAGAFVAKLGKPLLERSLAYSRTVMEICAEAQSEAQQVVAHRFGVPEFRIPVAQDWHAGVDMFTRGVRELSTMTTNNLAAASDAGARMADSMHAAAKKVA
ncbi:MAG: phasin family protein [Thauera sp.]|jgi:phasin family protein|nr:phasin family protein [Thauera sp.]